MPSPTILGLTLGRVPASAPDPLPHKWKLSGAGSRGAIVWDVRGVNKGAQGRKGPNSREGAST